jgi:hypothetical protein
MEEGGRTRTQVVYQKKNKDGRTRMIKVIKPRQNGCTRNKFPRALITWNSKFEGQEERKEEPKNNTRRKKKHREKISWNAPRQQPTTLHKRIGLRCLPKILRDPQSQLVRPTCRLVCALIFDGIGLGLLKVFRS